MAKRLSKDEKEEIIQSFTEGKTIEELSENYECSKLTITRNLKNSFGETKYKDLIEKKKSLKKSIKQNVKYISSEFNNKLEKEISSLSFPIEKSSIESSEGDKLFPISEFMELTPLNEEIDNAPRKDLSSISINEINFPNTVYMIVDKKIELQTRLLKNFPEWQFLSQEDLNRKTIQIYFDLKIAKRNCNQEQKVIKVPNTSVFKTVSPILKSRGITRIVSEGQLISL